MSTYNIIALISGIAALIFMLLAFYFLEDEHLYSIPCIILAVLSLAIFAKAVTMKPEPITTDECMQEVEDPETGVHYFIHTGPNGKSSVTVRYNSDGTVYTEERE